MNANTALEHLLVAWNAGRYDDVETLLAPVYAQLRRVARNLLRRERPEHTLQPTALVHEAYVRIVGTERTWQNREHFFAVAAQIMRQVLVDHARARRASKRGGAELLIVPIDDVAVATADGRTAIEQLNDAIDALAALDPRQAELVQLRYFIGLTNQEAGAAVGVSVPTVERELRTARIWIKHYLRHS